MQRRLYTQQLSIAMKRMLIGFDRVIIMIIILILSLEISVSFKIKNHIHKRSNDDENIDEILKGKMSP